MRKLINSVDNILSESLNGFVQAHADIVSSGVDGKFICRRQKAATPKVALISGGGSGHEPMHGGYVGQGMLDAACPGEVFTSPTPDQMLEAAQAVENGAGVLFIVKNYSGDVMNFEMATEMLDGEHAMVITNDDVAVKDSTYTQGRRGVAGTVIVEKIVGAKAETGADLATCAALANAVNKASGTMGVALSSCTVPAAGKPTFDISDNEMEMGVGIHGEPGRKRTEMGTADEITHSILAAIFEDLNLQKDEEILLFVNGMGATPSMELYLVYHSATKYCEQYGVKIVRSLVGNYCTSLDMAGCSITLTRLNKAMLDLWDAPVHTAGLRWGI